MSKHELPPDFDLLYDIKTFKDFRDVWYDRPTRCSGTRMNLTWLCRHYEIDPEEIVKEDE
jgi:hypothetical protein